jgi:hypothetical protein
VSEYVPNTKLEDIASPALKRALAEQIMDAELGALKNRTLNRSSRVFDEDGHLRAFLIQNFTRIFDQESTPRALPRALTQVLDKTDLPRAPNFIERGLYIQSELESELGIAGSATRYCSRSSRHLLESILFEQRCQFWSTEHDIKLSIFRLGLRDGNPKLKHVAPL